MLVGFTLMIVRPGTYESINANWPEEPPPKAGATMLDWAYFGVGVAFLAFKGWLDWQEKRRADRAEAREIHDRRRGGDDIR